MIASLTTVSRYSALERQEGTMKRSTNRILTTHTGSLPRPADLIELLRAKETGQPYNDALFKDRVRGAVVEVVHQQADAGVDVVSDGELGKPGFFQYIRTRLEGMEGLNPEARVNLDPDFPGYQPWRTSQGRVAPGLITGRPECIGPLAWKDKAALQADIDNFKDALKGADVEEGFLPSASIGIVAQRMDNKYYPTYEAYVEAIANVMKDEYRAITGAGLVIQIDAPEMCIDRNMPEFRDKPVAEFRKRMELWVEALNHALEGIPEEQVRFHICWGNQEGPHMRDVPLREIADVMLKVHAAAYSVEASNPRHAHEWKVWQDVKLPAGKVLIPGVLDSTTNFVEHPELVADRIVTYANLVGRENVIAGTDCGFGTGATSNMIYPPIVWAKLKAMAEGAQIATKRLWGS
jgi:5-methyltetrahydropteroyltriglutamate--homocysteine methyltransferase